MADAQSVAEDQLRSIIERVEHSDARLRYAYERLSLYSNVASLLVDRAFVAGAYITGMSSARLRQIVRSGVRRGSLDGYFEWLADLPRPCCGPLPEDAAGYVYRAHVEAAPFIVKIGFSHDPAERMKSLRHATGLVHRLDHSEPGTWLDEAMAHLGSRHLLFDREWFIDPSHAVGEIPSAFHPAFDRSVVRSYAENIARARVREAA